MAAPASETFTRPPRYTTMRDSTRSDGKTLELSADEHVSERSVTLPIPVETLVAERLGTHEDWDVVYVANGVRSKVARLLDDIVDHKRVDRYRPWTYVEENLSAPSEVETVVVRPYFTPRQGLAVSVVSYR